MSFINNHRGPFRFLLTRSTSKGSKSPFKSEWLTSKFDRDEVLDEARAILDDTRDKVLSIQVWSEREDSFIGWLDKRGVDKLLSGVHTGQDF